MRNKFFVLTLITLAFSLWGCGDKLTEETAKQVLEKEFLVKLNSRGFTQLEFDEGTKGFQYFQNLIQDGSFELVKEEKRFAGLPAPENNIVKIYSPKADIAHIFKNLELLNEIDMSKVDIMDVMDQKKLPEKTVCVVTAKIKANSIQSVDKILNDEKSGIAKVQFTITEIGVAPYYDDLCPLMYPGKPEGSGKCSLKKPYSTETQMKKYDEGWTIDLNPS